MKGDFPLNLHELPYPGSKWLKHAALQSIEGISEHLPDTARLRGKTLLSFLKKYEVLYLKPSLGGGGKGVIRLRRKNGQYLVDEPHRACEFSDLPGVLRYITIRCSRRSYLIQQGIPLMTIDRRPVDFRSLLYKKEGGWHYAGIMGKIAAANRFTTNRCSGGRAVTLQQALQRSQLLQKDTPTIEQQIRRFSLLVAEHLQASFPHITEMGLDVALDPKGHIWLIEANTRPHYQLFRDHDNPSLYAEIDRDLRQLRKDVKRRHRL